MTACCSYVLYILRSWIFPCGNGLYQCSTQDVYYNFVYGPQLGCPALQNSSATPPPETTCTLSSNGSCSFVPGAPTCVSWLQDCNYGYSCTTEEEFSSATADEENFCSFPAAHPPSPDSICIPVNDTCEWYNPCRTWQSWCGGDYVCDSESQYAAFINGPQPLCIPPPENATEPVPAGECVYQDGHCVWSGKLVIFYCVAQCACTSICIYHKVGLNNKAPIVKLYCDV